MNRKSLSLLLALLLAQPLSAADTWADFFRNQIPLMGVSLFAGVAFCTMKNHYTKLVAENKTLIENLKKQISENEKAIESKNAELNSKIEQGLDAADKKIDQTIKNVVENYLSNENAAKVYATNYSVYVTAQTASKLYNKLQLNITKNFLTKKEAQNTYATQQALGDMSQGLLLSQNELNNKNIILSNAIKVESEQRAKLSELVNKANKLNTQFANHFWNQFMPIFVNTNRQDSVKNYYQKNKTWPLMIESYEANLNQMKKASQDLIELSSNLEQSANKKFSLDNRNK